MENAPFWTRVGPQRVQLDPNTRGGEGSTPHHVFFSDLIKVWLHQACLSLRDWIASLRSTVKTKLALIQVYGSAVLDRVFNAESLGSHPIGSLS